MALFCPVGRNATKLPLARAPEAQDLAVSSPKKKNPVLRYNRRGKVLARNVIAMTKTRWGILGTGNIASQFARGLADLDDAELVAVESRTAESPRRLASDLAPAPACQLCGAGERPRCRRDLRGDATPAASREHDTVPGAGKAVLCEKPFAINAARPQTMIATRARGACS